MKIMDCFALPALRHFKDSGKKNGRYLSVPPVLYVRLVKARYAQGLDSAVLQADLIFSACNQLAAKTTICSEQKPC